MRRPHVLLLWTLGAIVLIACAFTVADPAIMMFALDPELMAMIVLSSLAILRGSPAVAMLRSVVVCVARAPAQAVLLFQTVGGGGRYGLGSRRSSGTVYAPDAPGFRRHGSRLSGD